MIEGVASWRIKTLTTKPSAIAARTWITIYGRRGQRLFIDHRDAPATLDHIAPIEILGSR